MEPKFIPVQLKLVESCKFNELPVNNYFIFKAKYDDVNLKDATYGIHKKVALDNTVAVHIKSHVIKYGGCLNETSVINLGETYEGAIAELHDIAEERKACKPCGTGTMIGVLMPYEDLIPGDVFMWSSSADYDPSKLRIRARDGYLLMGRWAYYHDYNDAAELSDVYKVGTIE